MLYRTLLVSLPISGAGCCLLAGCTPQPQLAAPASSKLPAASLAQPRPRLKTNLVLKHGGGWVSGMTEHGGCEMQVLEAASGRPITAFEGTPQAPLHVILLTRDLSLWNYCELSPERAGPFKGQFELPLILPMRRSPFKLIVEYTPRGGERTVVHHDLRWGVLKVPTPALKEDRFPAGWSVRSTFAASLSLPPQNRLLATPHQSPDLDAGPNFLNSGARYQIALARPTLIEGQESVLRFQLRDSKGHPLRLGQPRTEGWARCVIVSQDTSVYLRPPASAEPGGSGSDAVFRVRFPRSGLYKAWSQWRIGGQVAAAAFVLRVAAAQAGASR